MHGILRTKRRSAFVQKVPFTWRYSLNLSIKHWISGSPVMALRLILKSLIWCSGKFFNSWQNSFVKRKKKMSLSLQRFLTDLVPTLGLSPK